MLKLKYIFLGITLIAFNNFGECNDFLKNNLFNNAKIQINNANNLNYINNDFQTIIYSTKCRDSINYNNHVFLTIIDAQTSINNIINESGLRNVTKYKYKYIQTREKLKQIY